MRTMLFETPQRRADEYGNNSGSPNSEVVWRLDATITECYEKINQISDASTGYRKHDSPPCLACREERGKRIVGRDIFL